MRCAVLCFLAVLMVYATPVVKAQWVIEESHTTSSLRGVHSLGGGVAWASGTDGTVLRTEDGGYVWQGCAIPPGAEHLDFRSVQAFDENTAIVMSSGKGDLSRLYKTTDGCLTWKLLFTNPDKDGFWDAVQFVSRDQGILLGDPVGKMFVVMVTLDGGFKWNRQAMNATADANGEGAFAASNSSLLVTRMNYRRFCTGGFGATRVITMGVGNSDEGKPLPRKKGWDASLFSERLHTSSHVASSGCFSIADGGEGARTTVAVGGDYTLPDAQRDTAWTSARGDSPDRNETFTFHPTQTPPHGYRSSVAYDASHKTWITVGPNGTDISTDDGSNWQALKPGTRDPQDADRNWNALSLPFVVGPHGRIGKLRTDALKP